MKGREGKGEEGRGRERRGGEGKGGERRGGEERSSTPCPTNLVLAIKITLVPQIRDRVTSLTQQTTGRYWNAALEIHCASH